MEYGIVGLTIGLPSPDSPLSSRAPVAGTVAPSKAAEVTTGGQRGAGGHPGDGLRLPPSLSTPSETAGRNWPAAQSSASSSSVLHKSTTGTVDPVPETADEESTAVGGGAGTADMNLAMPACSDTGPSVKSLAETPNLNHQTCGKSQRGGRWETTLACERPHECARKQLQRHKACTN